MSVPPRVLGRVDGGAGPTVVVLAGVHGDEPVGLDAARDVLAALAARPSRLRGRVIAVTGNRGALARGRRYVDEDLNRGWSEATLRRVRDPAQDRVAEDAERRELWGTLAQLTGDAPATCVDLHTMSGPGVPFVVVPAGSDATDLAAAIPAPAVIGLDERTDGALLRCLTAHGHRGVGVEGGAHDDPASRVHLAAAVWAVLAAVDAVTPTEHPSAVEAMATLRARTAALPGRVDIATQHVLRAGDGFAMEPGLASFDPVVRGQAIARDRHGAIVASLDGVLLLPNYAYSAYSAYSACSADSAGPQPGAATDHGFFVARATAAPDR